MTSDTSTSIAGPSTPALNRPLFPGFLSSNNNNHNHNDDYDNDFDLEYNSRSPSSSSSPKLDSPSGLPYLRDIDNESPIAGPSSSRVNMTMSSAPAPAPTVPSPHRPSQSTAPIRKNPHSPGFSLGQPKRRPSPLQLGKARETMGVDEEIQLQRNQKDPPLTAISALSDDRSSLANELQDLSLLRHTVRQNLLARHVDSPLAGSDSGSSGFPTPDNITMTRSTNTSVQEQDTIPVSDVLRQLQSSPQLLIIDTRPIGSFLESHFPRSANISIPSLIFKRFRKPNSAQSTSWDTLGGFVSTSAGRAVWDGLEEDKFIDVVVVGLTGADELAKVIHTTVRGLVKEGSVKLLRGGWGAVVASSDASEYLLTGENSIRGRPSLATSLPQPRSAPAFDIAPPPIPPSSPPRVSHRPSLPSLRVEDRRALPSLSINVGGSSSKRPPKLSLNLDQHQPLRSATLGSSPNTNELPPRTPGALAVSTPGFALAIPKSARLGSFQTLVHAQSKLPPSPSSFGDVRRVIGSDEDMINSPCSPWASNLTARPGMSRSSSQYASPDTLYSASANGEATTTTARNGLAPFIVSTILPSFLYLGPEISSEEDVAVLKGLGVKRILNVALECDDDTGLCLRDTFKYHRVPMRDIVEESGVAEGMRESCEFLDDARLHSAPTYVHCKAGKSRSVTAVLAYLIHANAWTLKTSYAYVAERRKGISPNIGFVAELMQFEESELGLKQSSGVREGGKDEGTEDSVKTNPRHMRESLPPTWSHSVDSHLRPPKVSPVGERADGSEEESKDKEKEKERRQVGDEREVRKNGQWVHHRRAPVDRTTLQPGRRVSKAGLESLRPLNTTSSPRPSPTASPRTAGAAGGGGGSNTPGNDGRLGWV